VRKDEGTKQEIDIRKQKENKEKERKGKIRQRKAKRERERFGAEYNSFHIVTEVWGT
jgi:hypothetical protein